MWLAIKSGFHSWNIWRWLLHDGYESWLIFLRSSPSPSTRLLPIPNYFPINVLLGKIGVCRDDLQIHNYRDQSNGQRKLFQYAPKLFRMKMKDDSRWRPPVHQGLQGTLRWKKMWVQMMPAMCLEPYLLRSINPSWLPSKAVSRAIVLWLQSCTKKSSHRNR